jgi:hypothetical protein
LVHHSKKVIATSFVASVIWTHQVLAVAAKANSLARATDKTENTTVLLSLLFGDASSSSSLGHV